MIEIKIELKSLPDSRSIKTMKTGEVTLTANNQKSFRTYSPNTKAITKTDRRLVNIWKELEHGMAPRASLIPGREVDVMNNTRIYKKKEDQGRNIRYGHHGHGHACNFIWP